MAKKKLEVKKKTIEVDFLLEETVYFLHEGVINKGVVENIDINAAQCVYTVKSRNVTYGAPAETFFETPEELTEHLLKNID